MEHFLQNLLTASLHGSVVILAIILFRLISRKTPKKYICMLWLLAGIRLLLPIEIRSDLSLQPQFTIPFAKITSMKWAASIPWIWGFIASLFVMYSIASYMKLKNKVREAIRIRGGWECDRIETAFILGFIKPRIYIPMGMNGENRKHILAHERTHLDKGDHWIKMIGFLALALHWFNPLVWVAYILLCKDIEMACDERVIRFMELDERKAYSAALLSCSSRHARFIASPVAFGEVSVKQRILSILNYKKPSFWLSLVGVLAFFFVTICLLTSPERAGDLPMVQPPEELAVLSQCRTDLEALFDREEYCYEVYGANERGGVLWSLKLYRRGEDTMWQYMPASSPEVTQGRLNLDGAHYVWRGGSWIGTEGAADEYESKLDLFRWDAQTAAFVEEKPGMEVTQVVFTTNWTDADRAVHISTMTYTYDTDGSLVRIQIENPNDPLAETVYFEAVPLSVLLQEKSVGEYFADAQGAIAEGFLSAEELSRQEELDSWGVYFRVDDDRLTSRGSDVSISQDEMGTGKLFTTDQYWIEKFTDGKWEILPTVDTPKWSGEGIGIAKGMATYGYLDWTPIYGELSPGKYRMGKTVENRGGNNSKSADFYSEFTIFESVDSASPEAKTAVERCYAKLEELKQRENLHWKSIMGQDSEYETWVSGKDYAQVSEYPAPCPEEFMSDFDKTLFPRTDVWVYCDGVNYGQAHEDPEVLTSPVLGMQVVSLSVNSNAWNPGSIAEDFNMYLFERSNHTISFPEGIGVVSSEMVRFQEKWAIAGGDQAGAIFTYRFNSDGELSSLEYKTTFEDGVEYSASIQIFEDSPEEISAKIRSFIKDIYVSDFSWQEAQTKYTADAFNIRTDSFVNTSANPVDDPVSAARLALKEYPNLKKIMSMDISRDETQGKWKVTIKSEVTVQCDYEYRDVYLSDSGVTQLLVYEGPIRFDEQRK